MCIELSFLSTISPGTNLFKNDVSIHVHSKRRKIEQRFIRLHLLGNNFLAVR